MAMWRLESRVRVRIMRNHVENKRDNEFETCCWVSGGILYCKYTGIKRG